MGNGERGELKAIFRLWLWYNWMLAQKSTMNTSIRKLSSLLGPSSPTLTNTQHIYIPYPFFSTCASSSLILNTNLLTTPQTPPMYNTLCYSLQLRNEPYFMTLQFPRSLHALGLPEILHRISTFLLLSRRSDLLSCMLVSRHWYLSFARSVWNTIGSEEVSPLQDEVLPPKNPHAVDQV